MSISSIVDIGSSLIDKIEIGKMKSFYTRKIDEYLLYKEQ